MPPSADARARVCDVIMRLLSKSKERKTHEIYSLCLPYLGTLTDAYGERMLYPWSRRKTYRLVASCLRKLENQHHLKRRTDPRMVIWLWEDSRQGAIQSRGSPRWRFWKWSGP